MLSRLISSVFPKDIPTVAERMATRTTEFKCISLIPYQKPDGTIDRYRPFHFPAMIRPVSEGGPVDRAVWTIAKIKCADDICVEASRAAGMEGTAQAPEAEVCRYIVFQHPIQKIKYGGLNSIVLENIAALPESDKALVVSLVERNSV